MTQLDKYKQDKIKEIEDLTVSGAIRQINFDSYHGKVCCCDYCAYDWRKSEEHLILCEDNHCDDGIRAFLESKVNEDGCR